MAYNEERYLFQAGSLGCIEGLTISAGGISALRYFGGLPYALPPTGPDRFKPPRKLPPDYSYGNKTSPRNHTKGTKICPQPPSRIPPNASLFDEDCLQLNIWIPAGDAPEEGWPVFFYLHGGFLQWGNANWKPSSLMPLLGKSAFRAIVVLPSYRLNALGFLTGKAFATEATTAQEAVFGNMGLWDQRTALEWVHSNIVNFKGDSGNITVAGYSAGAYSTFHQLAHELYLVPAENRIIRRVIMLSNGPGTRPKTLSEHQAQFDEFIHNLGIPASLDDSSKLAKLRELPYQQLIDAQKKMKISEFRPLADGAFYPKDLFADINNGDFARRIRDRGISIMSGECRDEHTIYRNWRTPENSLQALHARLCAEYPESVATKILDHYCGAEQRLPSWCRDWQDLFGRIYADLQVHHLQRGFFNALFEGGLEPGKDVLRYRFDRRLKCVEATIPLEWGVTHSSDVPIWLWGFDSPGAMTDQEEYWLKGWNEQFAAFVGGAKVQWGPTKPREMRRWRSDGQTDVWEDDRWEQGLEVWNLVHDKS
ncbi:carboxylesterase [Aureobasidium sp. EXF-10727]|nr:carboxylesterase [Aureobasidium sp. EXF-10727]